MSSGIISNGNCRVLEVDNDLIHVVDNRDRVLLTTRLKGIAILFVDLCNNRGSEVNLETGEWIR